MTKKDEGMHPFEFVRVLLGKRHSEMADELELVRQTWHRLATSEKSARTIQAFVAACDLAGPEVATKVLNHVRGLHWPFKQVSKRGRKQ